MNPNVVKAEARKGYKLLIHFSNNEIREFDVTPYLDKGIFTDLKDEEYFSQVTVAFGSVQWPKQQDFSKDTLYLEGVACGT